MSEKIKKALRMAVNIGCGFEGDAEDAASLLSLIETNEARIAELDAEVTKCHELQDSYCDRITELEVENAGLKQLPQPIKFWSDEKKQIYKVNERRTAKSGSEECGE